MSDAFRIYVGNALTTLRALPDRHFDCVITSPPYWGLRDYGTAKWEGGNDPQCDHKFLRSPDPKNPGCGAQNGRGREKLSRTHCSRCGARRIDEQLGHERTPQEYIQKMVAVFQEVRRVLADHGTLWVNMGDSYLGSWGSQGRQGDGGIRGRSAAAERQIAQAARNFEGASEAAALKAARLKPKDMAGMPWMLALALRDDGWFLRQDIIWAKPNPMPESVRDRFTKAHEYIFLFSKRRKYYFDQAAVREPVADDTPERMGRAQQQYSPPGQKDHRGAALGKRENSNAAARAADPAEVECACSTPGGDALMCALLAHDVMHADTEPCACACHSRVVEVQFGPAPALLKRPAGWNDGPTELDKVGRYESPGKNPFRDSSLEHRLRTGRSSESFRKGGEAHRGDMRHHDLERLGLTRGNGNQSCVHPDGKNMRETAGARNAPRAYSWGRPIKQRR